MPPVGIYRRVAPSSPLPSHLGPPPLPRAAFGRGGDNASPRRRSPPPLLSPEARASRQPRPPSQMGLRRRGIPSSSVLWAEDPSLSNPPGGFVKGSRGWIWTVSCFRFLGSPLQYRKEKSPVLGSLPGEVVVVFSLHDLGIFSVLQYYDRTGNTT